MAHRFKIAALLCLSFLLDGSYARAREMDPSPIFSVPESPQRITDASGAPTLFLCPLSKGFDNRPEQVMAETLLMEALGEGYKGMVAVGEVIRNRTRLFDKNAENVCRMPKQFSCWNDEKHADKFLKQNRAYYFIAVMAWLESEHSALTNGATDYHTEDIHPYWADAYRVSAHIGKHLFYVRK